VMAVTVPVALATVVEHRTSIVVTRERGMTPVVTPQGARSSVVVTRGIPGPPGPPSPDGAPISSDTGNRATAGTDGGVFVRDDLVPDPLAYYILSKA
jgi:hypothetical protein